MDLHRQPQLPRRREHPPHLRRLEGDASRRRRPPHRPAPRHAPRCSVGMQTVVDIGVGVRPLRHRMRPEERRAHPDRPHPPDLAGHAQHPELGLAVEPVARLHLDRRDPLGDQRVDPRRARRPAAPPRQPPASPAPSRRSRRRPAPPPRSSRRSAASRTRPPGCRRRRRGCGSRSAPASPAARRGRAPAPPGPAPAAPPPRRPRRSARRGRPPPHPASARRGPAPPPSWRRSR